MTHPGTETKLTLRGMGVVSLLDPLKARDEARTVGLSFDERLRLAVDYARRHTSNPRSTG